MPNEDQTYYDSIIEAVEAEQSIDYEKIQEHTPKQATRLEASFDQSKKNMLNKLKQIQKLNAEFESTIQNKLSDDAVERIFAENSKLREAFNNLDDRFNNFYEVLFQVSAMLEESIKLNQRLGETIKELQNKADKQRKQKNSLQKEIEKLEKDLKKEKQNNKKEIKKNFKEDENNKGEIKKQLEGDQKEIKEELGDEFLEQPQIEKEEKEIKTGKNNEPTDVEEVG